MGMSALQYARQAWSRGVYTSLREVLAAMKEGRGVEMRLINKIMSDILHKTENTLEKVGELRFGRVVKSATPNYFGLNELLKERSQYYANRLNDFKYLIKKFDNPSIMIGRRGQDIVRELSLETLEEGFLKGNPTAFTETELIDRIVNHPKAVRFASHEAAKEVMKKFQSTVVDRIGVFHEDGEAKFMLRVKKDGEYTNPPRYQAWSAESYADLVAITTAGEADSAANLENAKEVGTRLVKWNSTGKGVEFYRSIGDHRCARVDNQIASIEPTGTTINGVFYPYWKALMNGVTGPTKADQAYGNNFSTCHPHCRHRFAPLIEEALESIDTSQKKDNRLEKTHPILKAEADARALGIRHVNFGPSKNIQLANDINTTLASLKRTGKPMPDRLEINTKMFSKFEKPRKVAGFFRYVNQNTQIFFNPTAHIFENPQKAMSKMRKSNWFSSASTAHVIHHEVGHFRHFKNFGLEAYHDLEKVPLTDILAERIKATVSEYATKDYYEFIAEVYAGLESGRKFPDDIMLLYKKFGGPI